MGQPPPGYPPMGGYSPPPPYYAQFAPKPGCIPLRPLSLSDIFSGSISVVRRNPRTTLGISAVVAVLQAIVTLAVQLTGFRSLAHALSTSDQNDPQAHLASVLRGELTVFGGSLIDTVFTAILAGFLAVVVTEDVLGNRLQPGQVWSRIRPMMFRLVLLSLVIGILPFLGLMLCIAPGIWLWGVWAVAVPAMVVEHTSVGGALSRSRSLVSGTFWRVWGIRALGTIVAGLVGAAAGVPIAAFAAAVTGGGGFSPFGGVITFHAGYFVITAIGGAVVTTFTAPFVAGVDALLYVDLRMRKENLTPVLQQTAAQMHGPNVGAPDRYQSGF